MTATVPPRPLERCCGALLRVQTVRTLTGESVDLRLQHHLLLLECLYLLPPLRFLASSIPDALPPNLHSFRPRTCGVQLELRAALSTCHVRAHDLQHLALYMRRVEGLANLAASAHVPTPCCRLPRPWRLIAAPPEPLHPFRRTCSCIRLAPRPCHRNSLRCHGRYSVHGACDLRWDYLQAMFRHAHKAVKL